MARQIGRRLTPWQQQVADVAGEVLPDGRMAYPVVVLLAPRRAGKTLLTVANGLQRCSIEPGQRAWYTAQTGTDAQTTFRDQWVPLIEGGPLKPYVKVRKSNGSAGLWLPNGSRFSLFAPTETALHGQDSDLVDIDEAWAFDAITGAAIEAAVRPTMATRLRRQMWIMSAGGTLASEWLLDWRELGRMLDGPDQGICYVEYYPAGDFDAKGRYQITADLDDPATWAAVHPGVGFQISLDTLKDDFKSMKRGLFYRSYLNIFTESDEDDLIPADKWTDAQSDRTAVIQGPGLFVGYACEPDLESGAVVLARMQDGQLTAELVDKRDGTEWIPGRVAELRKSWQALPVTSKVGPATTLTRQLADLGIVALELDEREYLDACGELLADVKAGRIALRDQVDLNAAARGVAKSEVGDAWKFSQKRSKAPISPIVALACAAFKARHHVSRRPAIITGQP